MESNSFFRRVCANAMDRGYNSPHHLDVQTCFSAVWHDVAYLVTAVAIAAVSSKKLPVWLTGRRGGASARNINLGRCQGFIAAFVQLVPEASRNA
jgi:hypothetical protein